VVVIGADVSLRMIGARCAVLGTYSIMTDIFSLSWKGNGRNTKAYGYCYNSGCCLGGSKDVEIY